MTVSQLAKLALASAALLILASCAGSKPSAGASSAGADAYEEEAVPEVKEDALKEAHEDATAITESNHKLAREIFDAKTKLGLPTDVPEEESAEDKASKK
jgi:hypothetical protein